MTAEKVLDISDMDISETGHFRDMDISQNMDISETWKFQRHGHFRHGHFRDMDISETWTFHRQDISETWTLK